MSLTTDAAPRVHLTSQQVLQDEQRVKRLVAALSEGIFYDIGEEKATGILQECLKICGGSTDTLSQVLQNRFFGNHTPFYWAITNRYSQSHSPPLLHKIMSYGGTLTLETQEDIVQALRLEFDSVLYDAIKDKLTAVGTIKTFSASFFRGVEDRPVITASTLNSSATVRFRIPRFLERLMVDERLTFQFYALGRIFSFEAAVSKSESSSARPTWYFHLKHLVHSDPDPYRMRTKARLELEVLFSSGEESFWGEYDTAYNTLPKMKIPKTTLAQFYRNPFTANERGALSGIITITMSKAM